MPQHPLDPLSADEIREAVAIVRRERGVGERWRFASIELREPAKAAARDFTPGDSLPREAVVVCFNRDDGRVYKGRVALHEDRVAAWDEVHDGQPNMTVDEFTECDEAMRRDPRVIAALARRGITDLDKVLIDTWAYGAHLLPEDHKDGRIGWADIWYRAQEGASPYANPVTGLHLVVDLNRMELLEVEDTQALDEPRTMGEYAPALVPGQVLRPDIRPLEIAQPEGPSFTRRRERRGLAEVDAARRLQPPRGDGPAHRGLRRPPGGAPPVVRGDGRPVPRSHDRALPAHRVRRRRVGPGLHDDVARAGLRLPGRDPLPGRGHARHGRRAVHDQERDLPARGGRRDPVEARGRAGRRGDTPRAPAGRELPRHRGQLRVPRLLALLPGRQHRVRGAGHRDHGHDALRPRRAAAVRHAGRRPHVRAVSPALPDRPPGPRRRRRGEHGLRHRVRGAADRRGQPARARAGPARYAAAHRAGGDPGLRLEHPARLEGRQRQDATAWARAPATSSCPAAPSRP